MFDRLYGIRAAQALAWAYLNTGRRPAAVALLRHLEDGYDQMQLPAAAAPQLQDSQHAYALNALLLGRHDETLDRLERIIDAGWSDYFFTHHDPRWQPLRDNPRFQSLMREVKADVDAQRARVAADRRSRTTSLPGSTRWSKPACHHPTEHYPIGVRTVWIPWYRNARVYTRDSRRAANDAMKNFIGELRRRNVHRVALAYLAGSWLLIQIVETLFPVFELPDSAIRAVVILLAAGFIPAVIVSWAFEWTPEGLRRETDTPVGPPAAAARRFDRAIIVLLALAVTYLVVDKFMFSPAPIAAREASIAVLAFDDLSPDGDQAWFADGISEELLNLLADIPELRVAGRTSAFSFRGKDATIAEIGRALGVAHVVEGSVRKFGDEIRITVQLIDARTDTHLWSENYHRVFADVFAIQDEIAEAVVEQLHLNLIRPTPTAERVDSRAYALYLQARSLMNSAFTQENFQRIESLLERALALDPEYANAIGLLARFRWVTADEADAAETYARVRTMIDRGLALRPDNGVMLGWKSFLAMVLDNDLYTAARYRERAHEVDPENYDLIWGTVTLARMYGRPEIGAALGEYILARDPLCINCYKATARNYVNTGNLQAAEKHLRDALALGTDVEARYRLGQVLLLDGRAEEALGVFEDLRAWLESDSDESDEPYAGYPGHLETLIELGMTEEYETLRTAYLDFHAAEGLELLIAQHYAWIGEADLAFEWLDKHDRQMTWGIRDHLARPWYQKLHGDPRWQALLERYHMTEADFEAIDLTIRMPPGAAQSRPD